MRIGLIGYGKMGKEVEKAATEKGHEIIWKVNKDFDQLQFEPVDVAIEFSVPSAAYQNIFSCFKRGIPVVSGTTGWLAKFDDVIALCKQEKGSFLYASNFSIGVNVAFEVNRFLAQLIAPFDQYEVNIKEIHHAQKADAPSGTAITLAEGIIEKTKYTDWHLTPNSNCQSKEIPIFVKREGNIPGTHCVIHQSSVDQIELKHTAHNRKGFAQGAVIAAEWLKGRTGIYSMSDVLTPR